MGIFPFILVGLLPWLLIFGAAVYLVHLWKRPGPDELQRSRIQDLEDQVSLMREFLRDAMERIRRLEEVEGLRPLPPVPPSETAGGAARGEERRALPGPPGPPGTPDDEPPGG